MTDDILEKEEMTAVLIAEGFTKSFWPITKTTPKVLLPVCNIPMIDYAIEFLTRSRIKTLIIFCTSYPNSIKDYVGRQKYKSINIQYLSNVTCTSIGDVLRVLDKKHLIRNDFVLLSGDVLGNIRLDEAISLHKRLRSSDKSFIITKVFKELPERSRLRSQDDQSVVILDQNQILQYDGIIDTNYCELNSNIILNDRKNLQQRNLEVRYDLYDTGIDICSPEVLHFFTDNFDYHNLRDQLMRDLLTHELFTEKFAAYIVPKHMYVGKIVDPRTYNAISQDMANRWLYPIVLETNLLSPALLTSYQCTRNNMYKEDNVMIPYQCKITLPCIIGQGTQLAESCTIKRSVIGRNCKLGENCYIEDSYLWEGVTINEDAQIEKAILCNDVTIESGVVIGQGSIICEGVTIKRGVNVPKKSRISLFKYQDGGYTMVTNEETEWGNGFLFDYKLEEDLNDKYQNANLINHEHIGDILEWLDKEVENEKSMQSEDSSDFENYIIQQPKVNLLTDEEFIEEVFHTCIELIGNDEDSRTFEIEINSLKFSHNKTLQNCLSGIIKAINHTAEDKIELWYQKWAEVILIYAHSEADQLFVIQEIANTFTGTPHWIRFHLTLKVLYDIDAVYPETILEWNENTDNEDLKKLMEPFVAWLEEDDEEEDSEEND